jgi:hypothetical protein
MFNWTADSDTLEQYTFKENNLSDQEKISYTNIYFFLKQKGYSEKMADIYTQMAIFKEKYHGIKYSEEQEEQLKKALKPVL